MGPATAVARDTSGAKPDRDRAELRRCGAECARDQVAESGRDNDDLLSEDMGWVGRAVA